MREETMTIILQMTTALRMVVQRQEGRLIAPSNVTVWEVNAIGLNQWTTFVAHLT
jgi:hypothetical protein